MGIGTGQPIVPCLTVAAYLRSRHLGCRLVKAKMQKVAALRKYLKGPVKSDRVDALTLAKMPFIDPEQLEDVYHTSAEIHALQRLMRQRQRLQSDISRRKVIIETIIDGYIPGYAKYFQLLGPFNLGRFLDLDLTLCNCA
jgi:hypothetical protein